MTVRRSPLLRKMLARLLINFTKPTIHTIPTIFNYWRNKNQNHYISTILSNVSPNTLLTYYKTNMQCSHVEYDNISFFFLKKMHMVKEPWGWTLELFDIYQLIPTHLTTTQQDRQELSQIQLWWHNQLNRIHTATRFRQAIPSKVPVSINTHMSVI